MGGCGLLALAAAVRAMSAGDCTIPATRALPCDPPSEFCPNISEAGGLYPGEVFRQHDIPDKRHAYCTVGGVIPPGKKCDVMCKPGWGDLDAGNENNQVACSADGSTLVWEHLPKCRPCGYHSYQPDASGDQCKPCPGNTYTGKLGAATRKECDQCAPGLIGTPPGDCRLRTQTADWGLCPSPCNPGDPSDDCDGTWRWWPNATVVARHRGGPTPPWWPAKTRYEFSHFIKQDPRTTCDVVNIVAVVSNNPGSGARQWIDGLQMFQEHINTRGGMRLGDNAVGYVNVTKVKVTDHNWAVAQRSEKYKIEYAKLCHPEGWREHMAVAPKLYLTPPDVEGDITNAILGLSLTDCAGQTFLAASEASFPTDGKEWPGVYSIYSQETKLLAPGAGDVVNPISLLFGAPYNARTFGIAGADVAGAETAASALHVFIKDRALQGAQLVAPISLAPSLSAAALQDAISTVANRHPEVFIGIGDGSGDAYQSMLTFFAKNNGTGYSPKAAFYMGGLAANSLLRDNAYTYGVPEQSVNELQVGSEYLPCKGPRCWSFYEWMGFVPWTADMPHPGPTKWPLLLDNPYNMVPDGSTKGDELLGIRQRYLGSPRDFNQRASAWLSHNGREVRAPTFFHAKAAASLLLFQMAVEFAPAGKGFGLAFSNITRDSIQDALETMNNSQGVETFWGPIHVRPGLDEGWNHNYAMSIGQFKNNQTFPSLVHFGSCQASKSEDRGAHYPAKWPDWCLVHGLTFFGVCSFTYLREREIVVWAVVSPALMVAICIACCVHLRRRNRRYFESTRGMRRSLLGSSELPNTQLTERNVASRWATTRVTAQANSPLINGSGVSSGTPGSNQVSFQIASGGSAGGINSSARTYSGLTQQTQVPVMFTDSHVRELQPPDFRQMPKNRLGKGSYGTVYRAEWRGFKVAVKAIELPRRPQTDRDTALEAHKKKLQKITADFVKEVDVGCELLHPNLVQMLGYATEPVLFIVQELMAGGSLDRQLYVEHWHPDTIQLLKGALDVAQAMEHLHTHFERGAKGRESKVTRPIIHRDLKSPNILLDRSPPLSASDGDWPVEFKVSDFGLSRDKPICTHDDKTGLMSGVGSMLWMAPEVLRGDTYNESVDVYSYAMVLVELSHGTMPWQDTGARPHEVPHRVTNDERPVSQLEEAPRELQDLIKECWHKFPAERPNFTEIAERVTEMYLNANRDHAERLSNVQESSAERNTFTGERSRSDTSTEYGSSRPASPSRLQRLDTDTSTDMSDMVSF